VSKLETPMIRWYWQQFGGTLVEEFCAVRRGEGCSNRLIDGIIKGGEPRIARGSEVNLAGKDIVVVQAKAKRLGMYLMGQALFSAELLKRFNPRSIESVAIVTKDDAVLRSIFEKYEGMRVVVCPPEIAALARHAPISSSVSNHPIQRSRLLPQRLAPSPSAVRAEHDASECGTFAFGNQVFALLLDLAEQVTLNNLRVYQGGLSKR